jgi:hypothetical protein
LRVGSTDLGALVCSGQRPPGPILPLADIATGGTALMTVIRPSQLAYLLEQAK